MMKQWDFLFEPLKEMVEFRQIVKKITNNDGPAAVSGLTDSQKAHFSSGITHELGKRGLFVVHGELQAKALYDDFRMFFGEKVVLFPARDVVVGNIDAQTHLGEQQRAQALSRISAGEYDFIVTSIEAVSLKTFSPQMFVQECIRFEVGQVLQREKLLEDLVHIGFVREDMIDARGQFAARGGIVDVFPIDQENPIRIEFFDDEVDSVRCFDLVTQRSIEEIDGITVYPCREGGIEQPEEAQGIGIQTEVALSEGTQGEETQSEGTQQERSQVKRSQEYGLFDFLDEDCVVFIDELQRCQQRMINTLTGFYDRVSSFREQYETASNQEDEYLDCPYFEFEDIMTKLLTKRTVLTMTLVSEGNIGTASEVYDVATRQLSAYGGVGESLVKELIAWKEQKKKVVLLTGNKSKGERLSAFLAEEEQLVPFVETPAELHQGAPIITEGVLRKGFEYPAVGLVIMVGGDVATEEEQKRNRQKRARRKKREEGSIINSFTEMKVGDYVVHNIHGIGRFIGIEQVSVEGVTRDYIKIMYAGDGYVFIPTDQTDTIQKYIGSEGKAPRLNRLGGSEWHRAKRRVKESLLDLAEELVCLYATRQRTKGFAFSEDSVWQRQFEDEFPYVETPDQLNAIDDVKRDMESARPMERLLCGDVGFGKTEVAMRAVFKAVMDGKQAAYLCPTTVLAQQQYEAFVERMREYPVKVSLLSRFCSKGQQLETIHRLREGEVDIVVGTHRMLSKDVKYKNLGLLVIDEEQRFGVKHKESIKEMSSEIDVLTMTATPIPRTLHMSLNGIRDISLLETPPEDRHPVQTFVAEYDENLIKDAIEREVARGGQVFYLYNRVRTLHLALERLQELLPDVRIGVAHGQMKENALEEVIHNFINGAYDVLLCTTIIESGIDMPNVNTLIVENAELMGLAQLYQIRGRVGRSSRIAYAYVTYRRNKILTEEAEKRLQSIKEFTEFGSGFKVAMRDLEIRGAGNLLGPEQHGQMETVGYGMYCRLLEEAVGEIKNIADVANVVEVAEVTEVVDVPGVGAVEDAAEARDVVSIASVASEARERRRLTKERLREITESRMREWIEAEADESEDVKIDIKVSAFISADYIPSEKQRVFFYGRMAKITDEEEASDVRDELIDRYGEIPEQTEALIQIGLIKHLAKKSNIAEVLNKRHFVAKNQRPNARAAAGLGQSAVGGIGDLVFRYKKAGDFQVESIPDLLEKYGKELAISATGSPELCLGGIKQEDIMTRAKEFLQILCRE